MIKMITPENINEVLNEVMSKLDEAKMILACPGCSNNQVGEFRCEALNSVQNTSEDIRNLIHKTYIMLS